MFQKANSAITAAVADLGLGDMLGMQVSDETDEMRKKRMAQMQDRGLMGGPAGSPATMALFGAGMGNRGA